jgi:hypothetical protein
MYGLTKKNRSEVLDKIEKQKDFLYSHYIELNGEKVQLASFFKNTFINADRYIAELQHRVWSLVEFAQSRDLVNVFITLTLPSEYHRKKTLRNGKMIRNPKFAHQNIRLFDIETKKRAKSYNQLVIKYYKTLDQTKWTGKLREISLDPKDYMPVPASKQLTKMWETIRKDRSWQDLEKDDRLYFRVTEPHGDGTPHVHISAWVPKNAVARLVEAIHRLYPAPMADIATSYIPNGYELYEKVYKRDGKWHSAYKPSADAESYIKIQIENTVSYLMKYIYKTLDDLRDDKGITEITMWYIYHGICRFYTSRTLISLNVYRPLNGRFGLLELTQHYKDDTVTVWLDTDTKQPRIIQYEDFIMWNKKDFELKQFDKDDRVDYNKPIKLRTIDIEIDGEEFYMYRSGSKLYPKSSNDEETIEDQEYITPVTRMKMVQLWNYYHSLDPDDPTLNIKHFGLVQNTMIERGLIEGEIVPLDQYNTEIFYNEEVAI